MQAGHRPSEGRDKKGSSLWIWRVEWVGCLNTALDSLSSSAITVFRVEASLPIRVNGSCITWPMSADQVTHQEPAILQIARHNFVDKDVLGEPYISLSERFSSSSRRRRTRQPASGGGIDWQGFDRLLLRHSVSSLLSQPAAALTGSQYCCCLLCCQCFPLGSSSSTAAAGWFGLVGTQLATPADCILRQPRSFHNAFKPLTSWL